MMTQIKKIIFLSLFVLVSFSAVANADDPPTPAGGGVAPPPPPPGLPIDGGILAGVCLALVYGAKKTLLSKDKE
ncbi:hypothetical protein Q4566_05485 [Tamlana sp. 2_MG-2023]|uniref:hypothetical protein n=1 Tax=unclassified Tamlana TaxID=2614803 RepID=UPI0026E3FC47|nr:MULTISPECIES: hypothetical protein [unclassified Tamlana]MDO6759647.1 hypothetical protein [Tamlana sp. 2_MG-2023]MDO6791270.1 hypothetical protein [Tamlana sp. 1_MG-2023]